MKLNIGDKILLIAIIMSAGLTLLKFTKIIAWSWFFVFLPLIAAVIYSVYCLFSIWHLDKKNRENINNIYT
jgi:predicted membrane protein